MNGRAMRNMAAEDDLEMAVEAARERYAASNPRSLEMHRAAASMPGGNTRSVLHYAPFPLAFARGEGARLWSVDGDRYTDFLGEYSAGLYGHSHPRILEAVKATLDGGLSFGGRGVAEEKLAAAICARFPAVDLVRFTNSGTEANLMAVAASVAITGREEILVFDGAYHGGVLSFAGRAPLNVPHAFVVARYNDIGATQSLIRQHAGRLAAILVEPMMGAGGSIPATADFLRMLREEASAAGALLIFDEVMTSRLSPGGLQAVHALRPDLTTLGKYLGGGMSFGAFGGRRDLMERFDPARADALFHSGTFNNNVLSMAAGVVGLTEIFTPDAARDLNARGDELRASLNDVFARRGVAMQATGFGSLMTIHATKAGISSPADLASSNQLAKELLFLDLLADGFWIARRGMMSLSLPISDADCERLVASIGAITERRARLLAS